MKTVQKISVTTINTRETTFSHKTPHPFKIIDVNEPVTFS